MRYKSRLQLRQLVREVMTGMRFVIWPSRLATVDNTKIVAGALGGMAVSIAILDIAFGNAIASLIR